MGLSHVYACVSVNGYVDMDVSACGDQRGAVDSLELESQATVRDPM